MKFRTFRNAVLAATFLSSFGLCLKADAQTKIVQNTYSGVFWWLDQEDGFSWFVPYPYRWKSLVVVSYKKSGSTCTITKIDQSVDIFGGAIGGNPCGLDGAVSVDVFDGSAYVGTVSRTTPGSYYGSYLYNTSTDLCGGWVTPLNWKLKNPVFKANVSVFAWDAWGWFNNSYWFSL